MTSQRIKQVVMGSSSPEDLFKTYWEDNGFGKMNTGDGNVVSVPVQRRLNTKNASVVKQFTGTARKAIVAQVNKTMNSSAVSASTPLIFDPEILSILFANAPILEQIPMEGQQGFKAVYNRVDSRSSPIGYSSESAVIDLSSSTAGDISFAKEEVDMKIYVDLVEISDFTQAAADHYMNVADTTLGERVALYAQRKEQQILYGDNSIGLDNGWFFDTNGFDGLKTIYTAASNNVDKSGVSTNVLDDIKSVILGVLQNENVNISDLRIACSWTMFDTLGTELAPGQTRLGPTQLEADIGIQTLRIQGVPVTPTHNIRLHQKVQAIIDADETAETIVVAGDWTSVLAADDTFPVDGANAETLTVASTSYSSGTGNTTITVDALTADVTGDNATFDLSGDDGDVFVWNVRATRYRSLVPFSTVPLAKLGLSETTALFEFGALVERSGGNWGRFLSAYNI